MCPLSSSTCASNGSCLVLSKSMLERKTQAAEMLPKWFADDIDALPDTEPELEALV